MIRKLLIFLISSLFIFTNFTIILAEDFHAGKDEFYPVDNVNEECAGLIATGGVCQNSRSILWKTRHSSDNDYYVKFYQGEKYDYISIQTTESHTMDINEKGLAVASFTGNWPDISSGNRQRVSNADISKSDARKYILSNYETVGEAANYLANHMPGGGGAHTAIISSEPGVGAIVSYNDINGITYTHITWVNNSWEAIDNALHCEHINGYWDSDNNGLTIKSIWTNITTYGASSNYDNKITVEDVCHLGAKNVNFQEFGSADFSISGEISRSSANSAFVVLSGGTPHQYIPEGMLDIAYVQIGREAHVGTFFPIIPSFLESNLDIYYALRDTSGYEKFMEWKVNYATNGQGFGNYDYDPLCVRDIQSYSNMNEKYMFKEYQEIYDERNNFPPWTIAARLGNFISDMSHDIHWHYLANETIDTICYPNPNKPIIIAPQSGKAGTEIVFRFESEKHDIIPIDCFENPQLFFMVDWGDNSPKFWHGPFPPDERVEIPHIWDSKGNYIVKVKAINKWGQESDWSDQKMISITSKSKMIDRPFKNFLDYHPNLFLMIRLILEKLGLFD